MIKNLMEQHIPQGLIQKVLFSQTCLMILALLLIIRFLNFQF